MLWWLPTLLACASGPTDSDGADASTSETATDTAPPTSETWVAAAPLQAFRDALEADGWEVQVGGITNVDLEDCCNWETCHARNPNSYYAMYDLPMAPGEAERPIDDAIKFRMRRDEVVVFVGRTPPPARYFSFRTYVHGTWDADAGEIALAYTSLGESLNQVVLGTYDDAPTAPFGATTVVMTAADAAMEQQVRQRLIDAGFPDDVINLDVIPPSRADLGLDETGSTIRMNLRVSRFDDDEAGAAYLEAVPGEVLRIRPPEPIPDDELQPLAAPDLREPGGGPTEHHLQPTMDALREAVRDTWGADHLLLDGEIEANQPPSDMACWPGCNRDSTYGGTQVFLMPAAGPQIDVLVYGVNHEATGMVSYANSILIGRTNSDPAAFVDTSMVAGSAEPYLPGHPDVDQLYVWRFSRDCGADPYCSEVDSGCPGLEPGENARVNWRTYLDPRTGTHVDQADLIMDEALFLTPIP